MKNAKILIVEDEAIVAEDLENAITGIGYEVIGRAVSANNAINAAIDLEPDLILMDIVLKGKKNGIDASQVINEKLDIPIIFLTAYSDVELLDRAKVTEPYAYIIKPFQERQLLASIEMSLYKSKMEKRLKESEERFRSIAENALEWIWEIDTNGKYTYTSPGVEKVLGYEPEEMLNKHYFDHFHPEDREKDKKMIFELFTKQWPFREFVNKNKHRNGQTIWLLSSGVPMLNKKKKLLGYRGANIDITEEMRSEDKLKQTVEDLTSTNNDLEQIARSASHCLTEPLRMVNDNVQLLRQRYKDIIGADADERITHIKDGTDRIKIVIDELMAYSQTGLQYEKFMPISSDMVLDKALTNLQTVIKESDAVITRDQLPTVLADGKQLVRLFENLIDSAIKFHSEKPLHVHFSAEQKGDEWLFSVHNNGIKKYQETGISLAVCRLIVERHGGHIRIESGKGSTFYFTIPVEKGI